VADAAQIRKVKAIVEADSGRRLVVVSAPGKRTKADEKITDLLYTCHSLASKGEALDKPFGTIKNRFLEIAGDLNIGISLGLILDEVQRKIEGGASADYAASRGEYLSGLMIADFLGAEFIDAEEVVRLTDDGRVHEDSYKLLADRVTDRGLMVMPGFFGAGMDGTVKTFSRGGSDISGAIAARAVHAEIYENWTDVSGILMADPRIADKPKAIEKITYREIREMASIGASVFHEEAIAPVKAEGIPINVKNTNDPSAPGTLILSERDTKTLPVVGVSGKKPFRRVVIEKFMLNRYPQFPAQVAEELSSGGFSAEFELKGFDTLTLFIQSEGRDETVWRKIEAALKDKLGADNARVEDESAMIGIVGEGLQEDGTIPGIVLTALAQKGIAVHAVNYGGSPVTLMIAVPVEQYAEAIQTLARTVAEV